MCSVLSNSVFSDNLDSPSYSINTSCLGKDYSKFILNASCYEIYDAWGKIVSNLSC